MKSKIEFVEDNFFWKLFFSFLLYKYIMNNMAKINVQKNKQDYESFIRGGGSTLIIDSDVLGINLLAKSSHKKNDGNKNPFIISFLRKYFFSFFKN